MPSAFGTWSILFPKFYYAKQRAAFVLDEQFVLEAEMERTEVAAETGSVHTPAMTLKNAALLALIGTILMTALLVWNFVFTLLSVLRDLVPAVTLFSSFIYAFGCFSVAVFFYVFHRAQ
jgi:hypothetical protein